MSRCVPAGTSEANLNRLAAVITFYNADRLSCERPFFHQAAAAKRRLQTKRDLGFHIRKLHLHKLRCSQRAPKLHTIQRILPSSRIKPLIAPLCASLFAHTTNTSAIGALVIHILLPVSR